MKTTNPVNQHGTPKFAVGGDALPFFQGGHFQVPEHTVVFGFWTNLGHPKVIPFDQRSVKFLSHGSQADLIDWAHQK